MIYSGLEYDLDKNEFIIFDNQQDALNYKGEKKILLDGDLHLWTKTCKSLGNIYAVSGIVTIDESEVSSLGELRYCKYLWLNKKQVELFKERITCYGRYFLNMPYQCYLKEE